MLDAAAAAARRAPAPPLFELARRDRASCAAAMASMALSARWVAEDACSQGRADITRHVTHGILKLNALLYRHHRWVRIPGSETDATKPKTKQTEGSLVDGQRKSGWPGGSRL